MNKKIYSLVVVCFYCIESVARYYDEAAHNPDYMVAFTSGYVFKNDKRFRDVYGFGMIDVITADFCYYPWDIWSVGFKTSYWRAEGETTFLKQKAVLQQIPATVYVRGAKMYHCLLQLYGSAGAGFTWVKEKSYLGCVKEYKGLGEVELGLNAKLWRCINFTTAFRYLFPSQTPKGTNCLTSCVDKRDFGGCDLRAGFSFLF